MDIETTGLKLEDHAITEIAAVRVRDGVVLEKFSTLVNPHRTIPSRITKITGITEAMVENAPNINVALAQLVQFVGREVIVMHNLDFDMGFIEFAANQHRIKLLFRHAIDTLPLIKEVVKKAGESLPNYKLPTLAQYLGLEHKPTHRGLADCLATACLLDYIMRRGATIGMSFKKQLPRIPAKSYSPVKSLSNYQPIKGRSIRRDNPNLTRGGTLENRKPKRSRLARLFGQ